MENKQTNKEQTAEEIINSLPKFEEERIKALNQFERSEEELSKLAQGKYKTEVKRK